MQPNHPLCIASPVMSKLLLIQESSHLYACTFILVVNVLNSTIVCVLKHRVTQLKYLLFSNIL